MPGTSEFEIYETTNPHDPVIKEILNGLLEYNLQFVGRSKRHYTVAMKDGSGTTIGGAECVSAWQWMMVENLWVAEAQRKSGVGTHLMSLVEKEARDRECTGICLDTFSFQARGFYEKLGFEVFGELPDFPAGVQRCYMRKLLAPGT